MIKLCDDKNINDMSKDFGLSKDILVKIRQLSNEIEVNEIDSEIHNIQILMTDDSRTPLENVQVAVNKLGQIDKNEVVTPQKLVDKMLDKLSGIDLSGKSILEVNSKYGEFLIQIYKRYGKDVANNVKLVPSSNMTRHFIKKIINILGLSEQNILDINDKKENYNIKDFTSVSNDKILKFNNNMKFDVILANPPFDNGLHEKFEVKFFDLCKGQICWVSPASWLLGKQQNKNITSQIDKYNCNIETINGNDYFDAVIGGIMGIVYVNMITNKNNQITFDGKLYSSCGDITSYSNDSLLMEFKSIVEPLYKQNNLHKNIKRINNSLTFTDRPIENKPDPNQWCMRIQSMRGHKGTWDFYTLISNQEKELNKLQGQYKKLSTQFIIQTNKGKGAIKKPYMEYYFAFNTKTELNNFINYIKTDFVRCCLYLYKNSMHLDRGELKYIPYFDFSNPTFNKLPSDIDDYLFKTFKISDEIRKHIEEILPDYYNIRIDKN